MRATVLLGSAISGCVLGLFLGVIALWLLMLLAVALPDGAMRWTEPLRLPATLLCLLVLPALGAAVGYLEGTLKLR